MVIIFNWYLNTNKHLIHTKKTHKMSISLNYNERCRHFSYWIQRFSIITVTHSHLILISLKVLFPCALCSLNKLHITAVFHFGDQLLHSAAVPFIYAISLWIRKVLWLNFQVFLHKFHYYDYYKYKIFMLLIKRSSRETIAPYTQYKNF